MIIECYYKAANRNKFKYKFDYKMPKCGDNFADGVAKKANLLGITELRVFTFNEVPNEKEMLADYYALFAKTFKLKYNSFGDIYSFRLDNRIDTSRGVKFLLMFLRLPSVEISQPNVYKSPVVIFWECYRETKDFLFSCIMATKKVNDGIYAKHAPMSQIGNIGSLRSNDLCKDYDKIIRDCNYGYKVSDAIVVRNRDKHITDSKLDEYIKTYNYKAAYDLLK